MTRTDRTRKLKILSENAFRALSAKSGLAVTKPEEDEDGWDFLLQFPANRNPLVSLDKQASAIKCLVQIKATDNFDRMSLNISVSCLDQLARAPLPTFVVFYDYAGFDEPKNIYICHIDKERMRLILARVRMLDSQGKKELHLHKLRFAAEHADKIDQQAEDVVKKTILAYTGNDLASYASSKISLLQTLGFEEKPVIFRFATGTKIEGLVDAMLGCGEVRITGATISEKRFGIEIPDHEMQAGILTVEPIPVGKCQICCVVPETGDMAEVDADVIAPQIPGLPRKYLKLRIVAPGIDATIEDKKGVGHIQIYIKPDEYYPFHSLLQVSRLSAALCSKGAMLEFKKNGVMFAKAALPDLVEDRFYRILKGRLEAIERILQMGGFRNEIYFRPMDIVGEAEFEWIALAASREDSHDIDWNHDIEVPCHSTDGILATVMALKCKDRYLCIFCWWKGDFRCEGFKATATVTDPKIRRALLVGPEDVEALRSRVKEFREFCTKPSKALVFLGVDPDRLFDDTDGRRPREPINIPQILTAI